MRHNEQVPTIVFIVWLPVPEWWGVCVCVSVCEYVSVLNMYV